MNKKVDRIKNEQDRRQESWDRATKELSGGVALGILGGEPVYVHSNIPTTRLATKQATEEFNRLTEQYLASVQQKLQNITSILKKREQDFYSLWEHVPDFKSFKATIWPHILAGQMDGHSIVDGIKAMRAVQKAIWDFRVWSDKGKDKDQDFTKQFAETLKTEYSKAFGAGTEDIWKAFTPFKDDYAFLDQVDGETKVVFSNQRITDNAAKNLGFTAEHVWTTRIAEEVGELVELELNEIGKIALGGATVKTQHVGKAGTKTYGASDILMQFIKDGRTVTFGATIKTRAGIKGKEAEGNLIIAPRFATETGKKTFDQAFLDTNGSDMIQPLDSETSQLLQYLLVNYWMSEAKTKRISNTTQFKNWTLMPLCFILAAQTFIQLAAC